jgi:hypothetical protein
MCFCHSGDWNFSPAICKHEYDPKSLCGGVLHIHGFISTSIFLWVYCAGRPWSYTHSTKMGNLFSLHSSTNVLLLYCYPKSSFLIKSNELNWLLWCMQFNDILNVFFGSPLIITILVASFLDNTLTRHVTKKDRGMVWTRKFRHFDRDPRNLEFYRLPLGLHRFFPEMW